MSRLDDVQAAHDVWRSDSHWPPDPHKAQRELNAAIPGLVAIARAARSYRASAGKDLVAAWELDNALAEFEAGRDG